MKYLGLTDRWAVLLRPNGLPIVLDLWALRWGKESPAIRKWKRDGK